MYALDQFLAMTRMRQKLMQREMVQNAAKVTALQRAGESDKEGINKVRSEPKVFENKRVSEANSELAKKKAAAEVEAAKAVAAELQGEVEKMNALTTNEKLKAGFLSKASAQYETKVQEANWELYKKQKEAEAALFERKAEVEATLFEKKAEAEAQIALADATLYARKQEAEADLYAKKKEAEGIVTIGQAQGVYISTLLKACCHEERGM